MRRLSFVVLTWNSASYIMRCVDSIHTKCVSEKIDYEIIVIDNGSQDNTVSLLQEKARKLKNECLQLIAFPKNTGTTVSRNTGLRQAKGDIICIIDSDTEINSGSLSNILDQFERQNSLGMVVPRLIFPDGTVQHSVKKLPAFFDKLLKIPKAVLGLSFGDRDFYADFPFTETRDVDSAISACWFFERKILDEVGYLDENIFYSPEDLDFCMRLMRAGLRIVYWPDFEVIHHTQQISHKSPFSKVSRSHFFGLIYYYRKHGGWFSVRS